MSITRDEYRDKLIEFIMALDRIDSGMSGLIPVPPQVETILKTYEECSKQSYGLAGAIVDYILQLQHIDLAEDIDALLNGGTDEVVIPSWGCEVVLNRAVGAWHGTTSLTAYINDTSGG